MQLTFQALPAVKGTLRDRVHCPELGFTLEIIDTRKETFDSAREVEQHTVCFFSPFSHTPFEESQGWHFKLLDPAGNADTSSWNTYYFVQAADTYLRKFLQHEPLGFAAEPTFMWEAFQEEGDFSDIWPDSVTMPDYTPEQLEAMWNNTFPTHLLKSAGR